MRKEIAESWVKALRSDKYRQGDGYLKKHDEDGNQFCCLGVLCEVMGMELHSWDEEVLDDEKMKLTGIGTEDGELEEPVTYRGKVYTNLAALNDAGAPFKHIADVIEANWEKL
jgi:hypothetical protein